MRIGIDYGGTKIEALALGDGGEELARLRVATPRHDYDGSIAAVKGLVEALEARTGRRAPRVGVGIPGSISPTTGLVRNANSVWLIGRPFDRDLAEALGRPVRAANDANCFALSEAVDGAGAGARIVFGVITGTGVGGGVVVDGRVLDGCNGIGGEWGHIPVPRPADDERPGPRCYCGRDGCLEVWLSGPALAADFARAVGAGEGDGPDAREISDLAAAGDPQAEAALARHADRFGRALGLVVDIVDPEVIVLGGGLSNLPGLPERVFAAMTPHVFSDAVATRIRVNRHGDSSGVRGAAWLWDGEDRA
ncbi:MAG: ROK family protein [Pseudomonadota bacterium]